MTAVVTSRLREALLATYGSVHAAIGDAIECLDRVRAENDAIKAKLAATANERNEAYAAIRADLHCDQCGIVGTKKADDPMGVSIACDIHAGACGGSCGETEHSWPCPAWVDLPYAAAVRAAWASR